MAEKSLNKVEIAGKVAEITHRTGLNTNKDEYISGTMTVEVAPDILIPVSFYSGKTTKEGKPNKIYQSLETVIQDFKTIAANGREAADFVEINSAELSENAFYTQDGVLIRGFQVNSKFFNRKAPTDMKSNFTVVGEIVAVSEDLEKDVPTGTLTLKLLVVGFGSVANIIDFKVENPKAVDYVKNVFSVGQEVKVTGNVVIEEKLIEKVEEAAFGDPLVTVTKRTSRKLVVTAATPPVESSIPSEDKQTMLATREARLSTMKTEAASKSKAKPAQATAANFQL